MNDPRINRTIQHIENSFFSLLETNDIHKISIKKLCDYAQISRSTFYDHYQDMPEFIESLQNKVVDKYIECMNLYNYNTDDDDFKNALFTAIKENRTLFSLFFSHNLSSKTQKLFSERVKISTIPLWKKESNISETELEIIYDYMMSGSLTLLSKWYHHEIALDEDSFKKLYSEVIKYGVYNFVYII